VLLQYRISQIESFFLDSQNISRRGTSIFYDQNVLGFGWGTNTLPEASIASGGTRIVISGGQDPAEPESIGLWGNAALPMFSAHGSAGGCSTNQPGAPATVCPGPGKSIADIQAGASG
jgi:hypothetical protein